MKFGILLILIGIILIGISPFISMASILYVNVLGYSPSGTLETPTFVKKGAGIRIALCVASEVQDVKAKITGISYNYSTELSLPFSFSTEGAYIYRSELWTVPNAPLKTKFSVLFSIEGNPLLTSYMEVTEITGYFTINGQKMDETTSMLITNPTLQIQFIDTSSQKDAVSSVKIEVTKQNAGTDYVYLTKSQDTIWDTTYVLPESGKYRIEGFFLPSGGGETKIMSVLAVWGTSFEGDGDGDDWTGLDDWGFPEAPKLNQLTFAGIALLIVGIVITFIPAGKRK